MHHKSIKITYNIIKDYIAEANCSKRTFTPSVTKLCMFVCVLQVNQRTFT